MAVRIADTLGKLGSWPGPLVMGTDIQVSPTDSRDLPSALGAAGRPATRDDLGVMRVGEGLDVVTSTDPDNPNPDAGLVSVHKATEDEIGGVTIGSGVMVDEGEISVPLYATVGKTEPEDKHRLWIDTSVSTASAGGSGGGVACNDLTDDEVRYYFGGMSWDMPEDAINIADYNNDFTQVIEYINTLPGNEEVTVYLPEGSYTCSFSLCKLTSRDHKITWLGTGLNSIIIPEYTGGNETLVNDINFKGLVFKPSDKLGGDNRIIWYNTGGDTREVHWINCLFLPSDNGMYPSKAYFFLSNSGNEKNNKYFDSCTFIKRESFNIGYAMEFKYCLYYEDTLRNNGLNRGSVQWTQFDSKYKPLNYSGNYDDAGFYHDYDINTIQPKEERPSELDEDAPLTAHQLQVAFQQILKYLGR